MRYLDLVTKTPLYEGAIDVSSVVLEAERRLLATFGDILKGATRTPIFVAEKELPLSNDSGDETGNRRQRFEIAMNYYRGVRQRGFSAAYHCMYEASKVLTKITQEFLLQNYGIHHGGDGVSDGVMLDGHFYPIDNIRVVIENDKSPKGIGGHILRHSNAAAFHAVNGGVASSEKPFAGLKIYLNRGEVDAFLSLVDDAVANLVHHALAGEYLDYDPGYYPDMLVGYILPTFAHELDHIVYYARKPNSRNGISIIGSGTRRGRRKYVNGFGTTDTEFSRYLGSHVELQAWATTAAAEAMRDEVLARGKEWMTIHDEKIDINDPSTWNWCINQVVEKVRRGKLHNVSYWEYQTRIRDAAPDNKVFQRVWRTFNRLLVAKLEAYRKVVV